MKLSCWEKAIWSQNFWLKGWLIFLLEMLSHLTKLNTVPIFQFQFLELYIHWESELGETSWFLFYRNAPLGLSISRQFANCKLQTALAIKLVAFLIVSCWSYSLSCSTNVKFYCIQNGGNTTLQISPSFCTFQFPIVHAGKILILGTNLKVSFQKHVFVYSASKFLQLIIH